MSKQAQVTFWSWVVGIFSFLLLSIVKKAPLVTTLPMLLFMLIAAALSTYVTNCVVVGQCHTYAWFLVALSILNTVMYVVAFLFSILGGSKILNTMIIDSFEGTKKSKRGKTSRK